MEAMTQQSAKAAIRCEIQAGRARLSEAERQRASVEICNRIRNHSIWANAQSVLLYAALPDELDLTPLLEASLTAGKTTSLPSFDRQTRSYQCRIIKDPARELKPGHYQVLEPDDRCPVMQLKRLDLVLVPGVGFTPGGDRLGRGKGYYDRLLAQVTAVTCGVALDIQLVAQLPREPHDICLDLIVTPTRWFVANDRLDLK